jgi:hypothetical protein
MHNDFLSRIPENAHHFTPTIKAASATVDIDLESPIDISQMDVLECSVMPVGTDRGMKFRREAKLKTFDSNGEEISITIVRISDKRPDRKATQL